MLEDVCTSCVTLESLCLLILLDFVLCATSFTDFLCSFVINHSWEHDYLLCLLSLPSKSSNPRLVLETPNVRVLLWSLKSVYHLCKDELVRHAKWNKSITSSSKLSMLLVKELEECMIALESRLRRDMDKEATLEEIITEISGINRIRKLKPSQAEWLFPWLYEEHLLVYLKE